MYHFVSGYTAKLAGTEVGVKEPTATFSACFGAPFMPRHPGVYAEMLGDRIREHDAAVWLINTGWTGGPYGTGQRMNIAHTRAMVHAAIDRHAWRASRSASTPVRGRRAGHRARACPTTCCTRATPGPTGRPTTVRRDRLAAMFRENFRHYEDEVSAAIREAGPRPV